MNLVLLLSRVFFSMIFILSGMMHLFDFKNMSQYSASLGVPLPGLATIITGIMILLGGLSILFGYKVKIGAILIIIFLVPTTFIAHNFWAIADPMIAQTQMAMFMKNFAMLGGAILFYHYGTGPFSIEKKDKK